jgi:hypothetical protein
MSRKMCLIPAAFIALAGASASMGACNPVFDLSLGTPGPVSSFSNLVTALHVTDLSGTGANRLLYVGGTFDSIGGVAGTGSVAIWNGTAFSALDTGVRRIDIVAGSPAYSTADVNVYFNFGGNLYIGGQFDGTAEGVNSRGAIRWNPTAAAYESINPKDPDIGSYVVYAYANYKGQLYAGGIFNGMGSVTTNSIARYDSALNDWFAVDGGSNNAIANVSDLAVFNDGSGEKLYAVGNFTRMGTALLPGTRTLAAYDGSTWQPVGSGFLTAPGASAYPRDLLVFDDGTGPALYMAGGLVVIDPALVSSSVNKWDGHKWTAIPGFLDDPTVTAATVNSMGLYNDGTGTTIYAQVRFFTPSLTPNFRQVIVRLQNGRFVEVPNTNLGSGSIFEFTQYADATSSKLYIGGSFSELNGVAANRIATITGCNQPAPACPADFNNSGGVSVQDIFDFLAAYFAGCP